jgi:glycine cleavage system H protein
VESVKAVEELKSPVDGAVLERNEALIDAPNKLAMTPTAMAG